MRYLRETDRPDDFQVDLGADIFRGLVFANFGRARGSLKYVNECDPKNPGTLTGFTGAGNTPVDRWGRAMGSPFLGFVLVNSNRVLASQSIMAGALPITLSCWARARNVTANSTLIGVWANGADGFYLSLAGAATGDPVQAVAEHTVSYGIAGAGTFVAESWVHVAGVFTSSTSRLCYCNGVAGTANTTAVTPTGLNLFGVGVYAGTGGPIYSDCDVRDPCIWSRALSPSETSCLADPAWSVMMGGAIYTRPNRSFVGQGGAPPATNRRRRMLLMGGRI
jgi:hypothetical protein